MANKVISIKMDEKDIEKIKKYYEALVESGFLTSEKMSMNGFYKHLLLDYLEDDVNRAFERYSFYGITPKCIDPKAFDSNKGFYITNTYNLDEDSFEIYKKCVKETLYRGIEGMQKKAELFNEVLKSHVYVSSGTICELECTSWYEMNEKYTSFWDDRAFEIMKLQDKSFNENEIQEEIDMIEKSSISEELKQKLIHEIMQYDKKRKLNYCITHGGRITEEIFKEQEDENI